MIRELIHYFKMKRRLRIYQEGSTISHFIARDVRRDVIVISNKEIEEGFVTVRIKTNNILYLKKGLQEQRRTTRKNPSYRLFFVRVKWSPTSEGAAQQK